MFAQIKASISCRKKRETDKLMKNQKFIRSLVLVLKYAFALLVVILIGSVVSMLVEFIMALLLTVIKYIINILAHIAEMMKENLILLGILIVVLAISRRISINTLVYRAFVVLLSDHDTICSICDVNDYGPCDYIEPNCGNLFHKTHMDIWLENHDTCPLDRKVVPVIGRRCQKLVYI